MKVKSSLFVLCPVIYLVLCGQSVMAKEATLSISCRGHINKVEINSGEKPLENGFYEFGEEFANSDGTGKVAVRALVADSAIFDISILDFEKDISARTILDPGSREGNVSLNTATQSVFVKCEIK
ncbi:MAG: hypothetical protein KDD25_09020 [Bdellovibrionales bacterium]|nr:hypothetical protein [Bdellovibrionales bacterium]